MPRSERSTETSGLLLAVSAYVIWGFVPLYVLLMQGIGALELIGWRILSSLAVAAVIVTAVRGWSKVAAVVRNRRTMVWLAAAGVAILVNWLVFAYAVLTGHVLETSLGYFLNPIVSVLFGVLILHERLRPMQWIAVGISASAVIVMIVGYGAFPWIAILLACSFGTYGLLKKQVGKNVDAITGFTVETATTLPAAALLLIIPISLSGASVLEIGLGGQLAVAGFGLVTALPLLLFSAAARRVSLTVLGFTQYIAPSLSFLIGAFVLGEPMPLARWAGFGLVWVALVLLTVDLVLAGRAKRRRSLVVPTEPTP